MQCTKWNKKSFGAETARVPWRSTAAAVLVLTVANSAFAETFHVTTNALTGEGSLLAAVKLANDTPGPDTIQFDPGLRIDLTADDPAYRAGVVHLTESVTIDGAGSTVFSRPTWVSTAGVGIVNRTPTYSEPQIPRANQPEYWETEKDYGSRTKHEVGDDFGSVWTLAAPVSALIINSGTINDVWEGPVAGVYGTASAKDISHVIACVQ
jgi:hypothetical protein